MTDIYVQPGGEGYVKWARARLKALGALRKDLGVPSLQKHFVPASGTRISIFSAESGDKIRITAGDPGGFVIYPRIEHIDTAVAFEATEPLVLNLKCTAVEDIEGVDIHVGPPYRNTNRRVLAAAGTGYFDKSRRISTSVPITYMPFNHEYTDEQGDAHQILLAAQLHTTNPGVTEVGGASLSGLDGTGQIHDISPNGRKMVSLVGDVRTDFTVDYAVAPDIVETPTTLDGYGTSTETTDSSGVFNGSGGGSNFEHYNLTTVVDATYPVCYGYDASNTLVNITLRDVQTVLQQHESNAVRTFTEEIGDPSGGTSSNGTGSYAGSKVTILTLPNGVTRSFVTEDTAYEVSGAFTNTFVNGIVTGSSSSASGTASRMQGTVEILYADASLPAVVYRYITNTYVNPVVASSINLSITSTSITRTTTVVALIGGVLVDGVMVPEEYEIYSDTEEGLDPDVEGEAWPGLLSLGGVGTAITGLVNSITTANVNSVVPTAIDFTLISPPAARAQSATLAVSIKDDKRLIWEYFDGEDYHTGSSRGNVRQAVLAWLPGAIDADQALDDEEYVPTQEEINTFIQGLADLFTGGDIGALLAAFGLTLSELEDLVRDTLIGNAPEPQLTEEQAAQFKAAIAAGTLDEYQITIATADPPIGVGLI